MVFLLPRIQPTYVECLMSLASLLVEGGTDREEEGAVLMQRAVELAPVNPDVHNNRGAFLLRLGECVCVCVVEGREGVEHTD